MSRRRQIREQREAKRIARSERVKVRQSRRNSDQPCVAHIADYAPQRDLKPFEAINESQAQYASLITTRKVTFGIGAAGTGKSYVALALAVEALMAGKTDRIVVVRPLVDAEDEKVGTLPGEMDEKLAPYFQPAQDILIERLGKGHFSGLVAAGRIEFVPLAFLRGTTLKNCWVILDEGQNTTVGQMKLLLTRLGRDSKLIVNGDTLQCDLPENVTSGLFDALQRFEKNKKIGVQRFLQSDIVRDDFVRDVIIAYEGSDGSTCPASKPIKCA